mgnify:CR=1 FL=1
MAGSIARAEASGAAPYNRAGLAVYDLGVLRLSNTYAWRCPAERLLAHYNAHLGAHHLDIGPGTGWYLQHAEFPIVSPDITLMDLNPATMKMASARLAERGIPAVATYTGSILSPIAGTGALFDSVAANFVMHCVPGTWTDKGVAFRHIAAVVADDGVFFGSTILGTGVEHNLLGKALSAVYNAAKVFDNRSDDLDGLRRALEAAFSDVTIDVVGTVAVFTARGPRRS